MTNQPNDKTDLELVRSALAGDRRSFERLVVRYQPALLRVARSQLGRAEPAEDAVQETFVSAFRALATFNSRYSFRTWLWTILLNQCRQQHRRARRVPAVQNWTDNDAAGATRAAPAPQDEQPLAAAIENERKRQLEQLLARLPVAQATALRLRFYGGLKYQEIADTMSCSLSSAKNRVRAGLEKMSQSLQDVSSDSLVGEKE